MLPVDFSLRKRVSKLHGLPYEVKRSISWNLYMVFSLLSSVRRQNPSALDLYFITKHLGRMSCYYIVCSLASWFTKDIYGTMLMSRFISLV